MTPGRASLLLILHRTRREFVAARCGVSVATVDDWCSGRATPGDRARATLLSDYEIPCDSWTLRGCIEVQPTKPERR